MPESFWLGFLPNPFASCLVQGLFEEVCSIIDAESGLLQIEKRRKLAKILLTESHQKS